MYINKDELLLKILAGENTLLEFKEVVFKGKQLLFASENGHPVEMLTSIIL